jgi:hypothetical protein
MNLNIRKKTRRQQAVKAARDLQLPSSLRSSLADIHPPKVVTSGAAAVVAATAASAAISALRRRAGATGSHG